MNKESKQRSYSPLSASEEIRDSFRRYILSTFKTNSETYNNQLRDILSDDGTIAHGPYLQISHNYPVGNTIEDLITEGVLSEEFHKLNYSPFKSFKLDFRTSGMTCRSSIPFVDFQDDPGTIVLGFYDGSRALAGMGS